MSTVETNEVYQEVVPSCVPCTTDREGHRTVGAMTWWKIVLGNVLLFVVVYTTWVAVAHYTPVPNTVLVVVYFGVVLIVTLRD